VTTTGSHNNTATEPYACGDAQKPQRCDNHRDANLYANPRLRQFATIFAAFYYQEFGTKLRLNDISLSQGGLFDVNGNWRTPEHNFHRLGIEVDVSAHVLDAQGNVIIDGLNEEWLTNWIKINLNGTRYPEGPIHYRINADDIDAAIQEELR
jgi:hypothetical protein